VLYTREAPPSWPRAPARLMANDLPAVTGMDATAYVCGSPGFCDAATDVLMASGWTDRAIRVERFGPSG
jgi:ferredoxin-NADP reductase